MYNLTSISVLGIIPFCRSADLDETIERHTNIRDFLHRFANLFGGPWCFDTDRERFEFVCPSQPISLGSNDHYRVPKLLARVVSEPRFIARLSPYEVGEESQGFTFQSLHDVVREDDCYEVPVNKPFIHVIREKRMAYISKKTLYYNSGRLFIDSRTYYSRHENDLEGDPRLMVYYENALRELMGNRFPQHLEIFA